MDILIQATQLLLSLSILVVLHEFGHFIPAKLFKTKVEKFYLFFDWKFSLFKKKIGETEWGIGWLPLGGYVKIAGMVDESMDKEQMAQPAKPWEFRAKPAWQRLIIMLGGVTVNLVLGCLIYILIIFSYGEEKLNPNDLQSGLAVTPMLKKYGFQTGDVVLKADGKVIDNAKDVNKEIMLRGARTFLVKHQDGSQSTVKLPENIDYQLFKSGAIVPFEFRMKSSEIDSVLPKSKSTINGILEKGDKLLSIAGQEIVYFDQTVSALYENRGKKVAISFLRGKDTLIRNVQVSKEGTLGFVTKHHAIDVDSTKIQKVDYSFGQSISIGTAYGIQTLKDYGSQMKYLFTKKGASSIGGFGSIGKLFPPTWDWQIFWLNTALISIILAFMNILPIPALDGGHVVFLLYEIITGKEAPQKVLEYAQYVGFVILLTLMIYANGNDIYKAIFG